MNVLSLNWFVVVLETSAQLKDDAPERGEYDELEEALRKQKGSFSSVSLLNFNYLHFNVLSLNWFIMLLHTPAKLRNARRHKKLSKRDFALKEKVTGLNFFEVHQPAKNIKTKEFLEDRKLGIHTRPYAQTCKANPCWIQVIYQKDDKNTPHYCQCCKAHMHELCFIPFHAKFPKCPWNFTPLESPDES